MYRIRIRNVGIVAALVLGANIAFADVAKTTQTGEGSIRTEQLDANLTMHTYKSNGLPGGMGSVNTHIFESKNKLLVIDAQMYKAAAEDVRTFILSLDKPVERIIISHAHPDHAFGHAYMTDLGEVSAIASVKAEAETALPFFATLMKSRMGDAATKVMPVDNPPKITAELPLGEFDFDGNVFEFFEMKSHETTTQMFALVPAHQLLMVFDAIMPNAHQLVLAQGKDDLKEKLSTGNVMLEALSARSDFDRMVFGHGIEPQGREQITLALDGLALYEELADKADSAEAFAQLARDAKPDWAAFYLNMTAGGIYR